MIISSNPEPHKKEFNLLLHNTVNELNTLAKSSSKKIALLAGTKLEEYVSDIMTTYSIKTPFENTIECIGGQRFPDIIAKKYYGVEVKTSTQNHWKTTGNSVLESTRAKDVERIFMLFGKLASPVEFKCRAYEECLSEVVVTHSPRYLIDMDLPKGNTIFDKLKIPYDKLRKEQNPIRPIVDYYKSKLKEGEDVWWMDQGSTSLTIKLWKNLTASEKLEMMKQAMVLFPEVFSNSGSTKFNQFAVWLVKTKSIVNPNVRDAFTAGGTGSIKFKGKVYNEVPRILMNLTENIDDVIYMLLQTSPILLSKYWNKKTSEKTKIKDWINLVAGHASSVGSASNIPVKLILQASI